MSLLIILLVAALMVLVFSHITPGETEVQEAVRLEDELR